MDLHGTAVDVECRLFLGSALKEGSVSPDDQAEAAEVAVAVEFPFEEEEGANVTEEMETRVQDDAEQAEAVEEVSAAEEPPALEFELDEIVLVDSPSVAPAMIDEKAAGESAQSEEAEVTLLDFGDDEAGGEESAALSVGESELDSPGLGIDTSSLTLDSFEEDAIPPVSSEDAVAEESSGQLTIDLEAIDLSDLVHGQNGTAQDREEPAAPSGDGGLDFEDTMDLSLFVGETHETPPVDSSQSSMDNGPEPIDLSLVDEALVDLAVDSGRQEQPLPEESHTDILELSMEDSGK